MNDHPGPWAQLSAGLPDEAFDTDGLLTKRVLRAYALAVLAPRPGERLWDLGAGTGSIGIEWCRLHPANTAIAVERDGERAARIAENATNLQVAGQLDVRVGAVASVLAELPAPDAVFVGGGVEDQVLQDCWVALGRHGRLAAHSVTADSDAILLDAYRRWGGELSRIGVEVAEPIGRFTGLRPLRSVTSWAATKH
ncbi:precorrin-6Y C5,15-methyltransferase (decarboxylating) subunit CbiT [Propioniciclava sp.]|uniref:precorrin-6Y C5,15-methyltransferase (decarboxylating) subunit CbiT n=1 Tax=Propioniciclava sp. TaxID=2038686 RepID=UPI002604F8BD|nr:precorrin-6Y C5,15-methyltransferase (decarboxylating) subunit CbiT [Propioniciclava sp.]